MPRISVLIHTLNEADQIEECINSALQLTSNIVIVDALSTDKTINIAKKLGVKVFSFPNTQYVEPAREFGIKKMDSDWVMILDADERLTPDLTDEIRTAIQANYSHYKIPRKNIFGDTRWLKHGGWWPDYIIRLINKKHFKSWPKKIHSTPLIFGECGFLKNPILHFFHGDLTKMVEKTISFENIESKLLYKAARKASTLIFFRKFIGELYRRLFKHAGFLDGEIGIIESIYQAFSKTITYLFLYEKQTKSRAL